MGVGGGVCIAQHTHHGSSCSLCYRCVQSSPMASSMQASRVCASSDEMQ